MLSTCRQKGHKLFKITEGTNFTITKGKTFPITKVTNFTITKSSNFTIDKVQKSKLFRHVVGEQKCIE
jgi:hypothetical protein